MFSGRRVPADALGIFDVDPSRCGASSQVSRSVTRLLWLMHQDAIPSRNYRRSVTIISSSLRACEVWGDSQVCYANRGFTPCRKASQWIILGSNPPDTNPEPSENHQVTVSQCSSSDRIQRPWCSKVWYGSLHSLAVWNHAKHPTEYGWSHNIKWGVHSCVDSESYPSRQMIAVAVAGYWPSWLHYISHILFVWTLRMAVVGDLRRCSLHW